MGRWRGLVVIAVGLAVVGMCDGVKFMSVGLAMRSGCAVECGGVVVGLCVVGFDDYSWWWVNELEFVVGLSG